MFGIDTEQYIARTQKLLHLSDNQLSGISKNFDRFQKSAQTVEEEDGMQEEFFLIDIKLAYERRIC